jgi:hypothetical protein
LADPTLLARTANRYRLNIGYLNQTVAMHAAYNTLIADTPLPEYRHVAQHGETFS